MTTPGVARAMSGRAGESRSRSQSRPPILPAMRKTLPSALLVAVAALFCVACDNRRPPDFTEALVLDGREVAPEVLNNGRDLYTRYCVSCHGDSGAGDGPAARNLKFPPRDFRSASFSFVPDGELPSHDALMERIRSGVPERGMPPWTGMREDDLDALANYIKTFSPRWREAGS